MQPKPTDVGVPHAEWRPNQLDMYQRSLNTHQNGGGVMFGELGTGSGKSAVACALGHHEPTTVLVHTLGLLDQYEARYNFDIIKGRQEYECIHEQKLERWKGRYDRKPTALDCHFDSMRDCPYWVECPYIVQKHRALGSQRMACTYRYAAVSANVKRRSGILVFDEAHLSVDELINYNEFPVRHVRLKEYNLPNFPIVRYGFGGKGGMLTEPQLGMIKKWIKNCLSNMSYPDDWFASREGARAKRFIVRLKSLAVALEREDWFLSTVEDEPVLRSLSAASIATAIRKNFSSTLIMSATIGDPAPLAREMGIQEYSYFTYPHPIPPEMRPIHNLHAPRMTHRNLKFHPEHFDTQAVLIWNWIKQFPDDWRGAILTTAYYKIANLAERLVHRFPNRRFFVQQTGSKYGSVSHLINEFITDVRPGDIAIGTIQGWGTGLDLYGELARFIVVAGVPHTNPTDPYGKARRQISGGQHYQLWKTYNAVMQACGRVSRGEPSANGMGFLDNYAALADGSATVGRAIKYYSHWFKEAFV